MRDYKMYSADSHVSEPGDLWINRVDKEFQFRAPRLERRERNGREEDFFIYEGFPPHPVSVGLAAAARDGDTTQFQAAGRGYSDARGGGWDPVERLKDQDIDGVEGEVIHTTLCFRLFWMTDARLQQACFRVYNDWLAEFCSHSPKRLVGVPVISLYDLDQARAELRRTNNMGLRGGMVWLSPPKGLPDYTSTYWDPIWAEAQDLELPLVLHEITGGAESRWVVSYWEPHESLWPIIANHEAQRTLAQLIMSGVFERFPRLKIISAENGTDWLPYFIGRLERGIRRASSYPTKLSLRPIEYFHRNVYFTYINEQHAVDNRDLIGVDNLMWASDYPHGASTWPKSREVVERDMASVSAEEARKLIHDNVLKLYKLPAPVLV